MEAEIGDYLIRTDFVQVVQKAIRISLNAGVGRAPNPMTGRAAE